jgi:hypothetical protein
MAHVHSPETLEDFQELVATCEAQYDDLDRQHREYTNNRAVLNSISRRSEVRDKYIIKDDYTQLQGLGYTGTQTAPVAARHWITEKMEEFRNRALEVKSQRDDVSRKLAEYRSEVARLTPPPAPTATLPNLPHPPRAWIPASKDNVKKHVDELLAERRDNELSVRLLERRQEQLKEELKSLDDQIQALKDQRVRQHRTAELELYHDDAHRAAEVLQDAMNELKTKPNKIKDILHKVELRNRRKIATDYDEWKRHNTADEQSKSIQKIIDGAFTYEQGAIHHIDLDLTPLTENGLSTMLPWFQEVLLPAIGNLGVDDYWIIFGLNDGTHHTYSLNKDTYEKLTRNLMNADLTFDTSRANVFLSISGEDVEYNITLFDNIHIRRRHSILDPSTPRLNAPRGGADFPYVPSFGTLDQDLADRLQQYLVRLEIGADNKKYSCFVYALKQAGIALDLVNRINSRCLSRWLSIKNITKLCDEFNLNISVRYFNSDCVSTQIIKPKYPKNEFKKIALFMNHYIVIEQTPFYDIDLGLKLRYNKDDPYTPLQLTSINLLYSLFKLGLMKPMTIKDMPSRDFEHPCYNDLSYNAAYCIKSFETIHNDFTFDDCVKNNKLIPSYSWVAFHNRCLQEVVSIGGVVKAFVSRAIHGGRVLHQPGIHDNTTLIDVNSLYPDALTKIVIPKGEPVLWSADLDLESAAFYVAEIDITKIDRSRWFYNKLKTGRQILDKYYIEDLVKYCGIEYTVLRGYVWTEGVDGNVVKEYISELYSKKRDSIGFLRDIHKNMLCSLCGSTMIRGYDTVKRKQFHTDEQFHKYVHRNHSRITRIENDTRTAYLSKGIDDRFNHCHIGCAILSMSKRIMNEIFDYLDSNGVAVYYSATDSLLIPTNKTHLLEDQIGSELGQLHIETSGDAIIIRSGLYYLNDEHYRCAGISRTKVASKENIRGCYIEILSDASNDKHPWKFHL